MKMLLCSWKELGLAASILVGLGGVAGCGSSEGGSPGGPDASTDALATNGDSGDGGGGDAGNGDGSGASAGARTDALINTGWTFNKADVAGAEAVAFDDSAWTKLDLPHTWNAMDGQDGPSTLFYQGIGWYRRHLMIPNAMRGQRIYLQFDGANIITDVFVNGMAAGTHKGGFATFRFDVTNLVTVGGDNVIAAKVNNTASTMSPNAMPNDAGVAQAYALIPGSPTIDVPPLSADFTFFGGIYRSVHLLATPPVAISPKDFGSSGVYVKQTNVSAASADLAITVKLSNATAAMVTANVKATVLDAGGTAALTLTGMQAVPANGDAAAVLSGTLTNPHLWNGLADPYLYSVRVELLGAGNDSVTVPLGIRFFSLDPNMGFSLNGKYLNLYGINKHQDHKDKGWAVSDTDIDADFAIIKELGANVIRLCHYQHSQHTYDMTDRAGLVTWAETPVINQINNTQAFSDNAVQQLTELIRQNYNHPSIVFWSVGNEVLLRRPPPTGIDPDAGYPPEDMLISHMSDVVAMEDPTRLTAYAANGGASEVSPVDWHGQAHGFNEYQGWYGGLTSGFATWADNAHTMHPTGAIAVTEYGAGASITTHTADPAAADTTAAHTPLPHYEEYQAYYHEIYWAAMLARPFLWGKFIWNGFDFATDYRMEGTTPGLNDKGLVSYDRMTKKDAFYFYKANWSSEPFVYITSRRYADLVKNGTTDGGVPSDGGVAADGGVGAASIKVYSNAPMVDVKLNGTSLGPKTAANHIFIWTNVPWVAGVNKVDASATTGDGGTTVTDTVTWMN